MSYLRGATVLSACAHRPWRCSLLYYHSLHLCYVSFILTACNISFTFFCALFPSSCICFIAHLYLNQMYDICKYLLLPSQPITYFELYTIIGYTVCLSKLFLPRIKKVMSSSKVEERGLVCVSSMHIMSYIMSYSLRFIQYKQKEIISNKRHHTRIDSSSYPWSCQCKHVLSSSKVGLWGLSVCDSTDQ